jgi:predicted RNA binding protein YcfA (HicA-like mRNA interferase family)
MSPKRTVESPRDVAKRLLAEGYVRRSGKGDHVNFVKAGAPIVTLDMGKREIPIGTLRMIYRAAGWTW